ncbi:MAG: hypothetical protein Q9227_002639 [Pyrenula ochraceoflavens]
MDTMDRLPMTSAFPSPRTKLGNQIIQPHVTHLVFICGTHVIGLGHLASSISRQLECSLLDGDAVHAFAHTAGKAAAGVGNEGTPKYRSAYERVATARLNRMGIDLSAPPSTKERIGDSELVHLSESRSNILLLTFPAHRKWHREALKDSVRTTDGYCRIKMLFVLLLIDEETLWHRFLGAETKELAEQNFAEKMANLEAPDEDENDVVAVDGRKSMDEQLGRAMDAIHAFLDF